MIELIRMKKLSGKGIYLLLCCIFFLFAGSCQTVKSEIVSVSNDIGTIEVGVARVDITPEGPIRLAGYGSRQTESDGILQHLEAKALAFGNDSQDPSLFITVDLIGIPGHVTAELRERLSKRIGFNPSHLVISSSHTHTGPEIGILLNHFGAPLPTDQLGRIVQNLDKLIDKLEEVAMAALDDRKPSLVYRGQGEVGFAVNRRVIQNNVWTGFGINPEGPVDHALPLLKITDREGVIRALLINYACHGTTLGPNINKIHNDWIGETQRLLEQNYPGAIALVSIGAGGDANPEPRTELEHTQNHAREIADEVDQLLSGSLQQLTQAPVGRYQEIELPFAHVPNVDELIEQTNDAGAKGYYARLALERIARGESIPESLSYPIQTWKFGDDLTMVFLAGEVVVDYSLRLKKELENEQLWVTAYANDVPSYIASRRVIREGGYEVDSSMYSYDRPSRFVEEIEDLIIETVHKLLQ